MGIAVADFIVQYSGSDGTKDFHHSRLRLLPGPRTRLGPQTFLQTHSSLPLHYKADIGRVGLCSRALEYDE